MRKVKQSNKNITPFGGLNFILQAFSKKGIDNILDRSIGFRNVRAKYSYSDVVLSLFCNSLCMGDYISDLSTLKSKFKDQFFSNIPSADTIEYVCQELKTPTIIETTDSGVVHEFNYNNSMNLSLLDLAIETGQLEVNVKTNYTLDFDNVVVETEKQDAKKSYKRTLGYHPSISFIGRLPVHLENRNGNTPARYQQKETLERCFYQLDSRGIKIQVFRADSASYQKEVIDLVSQKAARFYIRITDFAALREHCSKAKGWKLIEINNEPKEVTSIMFAPFGEDKKYRVVVTRSLKKNGQLDLITGCAYNYYGIITNELVLENKEIIEFYNQRGDAENSNRNLLNDFNLHHLPFPDMSTNTVYMYLMCMCSTIFEWSKTILVKNETPIIKLNMRVKAVCFHYIMVASNFIDHAGQRIIQMFSKNEYQILKI